MTTGSPPVSRDAGTPPAWHDDAFAPRHEVRPHRRILRALRISAWTAVVLAIGAAVVLARSLDRRDPVGAERIVSRELDFRLERGELVERRLPVTRRHWWHYFRVTHGFLVATDRRLLYLGVPPRSLLHRETEPSAVEQAVWPYADSLSVARSRALPGRPASVHLAGVGAKAAMFLLHGRDLAAADSLFALVARHQMELRERRAAEQRAMEAAREAARRAVYHDVRPGESLGLLATRYGASVDSLRAWNRLATDRLIVGQKLLVKPER